MIVSIDSGHTGWDLYVLGKNYDRKGAELIHGNLPLGNAICRSTNYANGQYLRIVVSFYDDLPLKKTRDITKEFMGLFLYGFEPEEIHIDMVEHRDTRYTHYHLRIPRRNLLTGTQLKLYWHSSDLRRRKAILDYLIVKYRLRHPLGLKKTVKKSSLKVLSHRMNEEQDKRKSWIESHYRKARERALMNEEKILHHKKSAKKKEKTKKLEKENDRVITEIIARIGKKRPRKNRRDRNLTRLFGDFGGESECDYKTLEECFTEHIRRARVNRRASAALSIIRRDFDKLHKSIQRVFDQRSQGVFRVVKDSHPDYYNSWWYDDIGKLRGKAIDEVPEDVWSWYLKRQMDKKAEAHRGFVTEIKRVKKNPE